MGRILKDDKAFRCNDVQKTPHILIILQNSTYFYGKKLRYNDVINTSLHLKSLSSFKILPILILKKKELPNNCNEVFKRLCRWAAFKNVVIGAVWEWFFFENTRPIVAIRCGAIDHITPLIIDHN